MDLYSDSSQAQNPLEVSSLRVSPAQARISWATSITEGIGRFLGDYGTTLGSCRFSRKQASSPSRSATRNTKRSHEMLEISDPEDAAQILRRALSDQFHDLKWPSCQASFLLKHGACCRGTRFHPTPLTAFPLGRNGPPSSTHMQKIVPSLWESTAITSDG